MAPRTRSTTEVFPKASRRSYITGIATALGIVLAVGLGKLGQPMLRPSSWMRTRWFWVHASAADSSGSRSAITTFTSSSWGVKASAKSVSGTRLDTRLSSHDTSALASDAAASR